MVNIVERSVLFVEGQRGLRGTGSVGVAMVPADSGARGQLSLWVLMSHCWGEATTPLPWRCGHMEGHGVSRVSHLGSTKGKWAG